MSRCLEKRVASKSETGGGVAEPGILSNIYYGWVMLPIAMATFVASAPGQTFGVSIFNEPIRHSLGLSHGELAAAYMLGTLLASAPIAWVGAVMDWHGLRRTMLWVIVMFGGACLLTATATGWFSLLFAFFCLRLLGPGALSFLSSNTLAFWFERRLGLMEGVRQLGMASAMCCIPATNLWMVDQFGWRGSYLVMGVLVWLLLLPLVLLLFRNRPEDVGQLLDGQPIASMTGDDVESRVWGFTLKEALTCKAFWIVTAATALYGIVHTAIFFCIVPIVSDHGLAAPDAASLMMLFALSLAGMNLIGGALADRLPAPILLAAGMFGLGGSMLLLLTMHSSYHASVAGLVMGTAQGLFFGASHPLWARYFGRLHLGKIRGVLLTVNVAASSSGPLFAGLMRDHYGNFDATLTTFAFMAFPLAGLCLCVRQPARPSEP